MLADSLKTLLATNFAYYLKAQGFHWNVEGPDFSELHGFFQAIYEDAYSALDPTAEYIRYLGEYSPASLERFSELTEIAGQTKIPRARLMLEELKVNNDQMLDLLSRCFDEANNDNEQGIANFLAERLSAHGKYRWQLTSYLKVERA
jgi:starvation-inducible DNA-binding protein